MTRTVGLKNGHKQVHTDAITGLTFSCSLDILDVTNATKAPFITPT